MKKLFYWVWVSDAEIHPDYFLTWKEYYLFGIKIWKTKKELIFYHQLESEENLI